MPAATTATTGPRERDERWLARRVPVAAVMRAAHTLPSTQYEDAFESDRPGADEHTPEEWARAIFEKAPAALTTVLYTIWGTGFALDLGRRGSAQHVLGWEIVERTDDTIVLDAESGWVKAQLIVRVEPAKLRFATFVHYKNTPGRVLFTSISPMHRKIAPYLVENAAGMPPERV